MHYKNILLNFCSKIINANFRNPTKTLKDVRGLRFKEKEEFIPLFHQYIRDKEGI